MARHHPPESILLDYATGALAEPFAVIVASHLTLCPCCRRTVAGMEAVGGAMLERAGHDKVERGMLDRVMSAIRGDNGGPELDDAPLPAGTGIPRPLLARLPAETGSWRWRCMGSVDMLGLPCHEPDYRLRLLRIRPGRGVPQHSHRGDEIALVLQGSFTDDSGCYGRGDVACADASVDHRQVAGPGEPCLCAVATFGRLRMTGPLGRLIDPFLDI